MKTTKPFENAKVGDKVFSTVFGWGEIIGLDEGRTYSICACFENEACRWYTVDGYFDKFKPTRSLFWEEVNVES
jgi:hypothetical protein